MISCGDGFSLALSDKGEVLSCGKHDFHGHKKDENINKLKKL